MRANCEPAPRNWVPTRECLEKILLELAPGPQLRRDLPPVAELTEVATVILDKNPEELLAFCTGIRWRANSRRRG
jgi:hypothetical protein